VIMLTATEVAYRCPDGAILTYRKQNEPTPGRSPHSTIWGRRHDSACCSCFARPQSRG
jgi:hypothetical protein